MLSSRRNLLLAGGGLALAATAGGAWRVTRAPRTARAPWALDPVQAPDIRLDAFRHAVLAPNPHNRQPWIIRLVGHDEAVIGCDLDRRLPETDPFDRQIVIGFGCFLEIATIAAAERGVRLDIGVFPDGEPRPRLDSRAIAHLRFVADSAIGKDPLFAQIANRRSVKAPYDLARPVPATAGARLEAVARGRASISVIAEEAKVAALRDLAIEAFRIETRTPRTMKESIDLLRIGSAEIDANPDGIPLAGPLFEALSVFPGVARRQASDPNSAAFKSTLARFERTVAATPAFLVVSGSDMSRAGELEAGRAYLRGALTATALGLALHPVSQSLQEFPEMREAHARAHELVPPPVGGRIQMLARLGYGPGVPPAPRWPLESRLARA